MSKKQSKKTAAAIHSLPVGTATSPADTESDSPVAPPATAAPTTSPAVGSAAPPDLDLPPVSPSFVPVNQKDYLGTHAKTAQIAVLPEAIAELGSQSSVYQQLLGSSAPPSAKVATDLTVAGKWTSVRVILENYLVYVKSNEAVAWKLAQHDLDLLGVVFAAIATLNPSVNEVLPAIARLLAVPKVIGQRGAATRARNHLASEAKVAASQASAPATLASQAAAVANPSAGGATTTK